MTSDADAWIDALRLSHDHLASLVEGLTSDQLRQQSTASEWDVSQVLSHLGSGGEINLANLQAQLDGTGSTVDNQSVWDRWDNSTPEDRAANFVIVDDELISTYEALDDDTRTSFRLTLSFLPEPITVATAAGMRLSEHALHSWDVFSTFDATAAVDRPSAELLSGYVSPFLRYQANGGWTGSTGTIEVHTTDPARVLSLSVGGDETSLTPGAATDPAGRLDVPAEAWLRLLAGRLAPDHTPPGVTAEPPELLDQLRTLFGGY